MKGRSNEVFPPSVFGTMSRSWSAALGMSAHEQRGPKAIASGAHLLPRHMHHNRAEIEATAGLCGCISCEQMFPQSEIRRWVGAGTTAVCPRCDTAAVVGSGAGFELTPELLYRAHQLLFEGLGLPGQLLNRTSQKENALRNAEAPGASGDVRKQKTTAQPTNPAAAAALVPFPNSFSN
jgi:hypothetical protein